MRPRHAIIQAQSNYLKTGDVKWIAEFYRLILATGLKIQRAEQKVTQDPSAVPDLASELVVRLMEGRSPVIRKAPSMYIKNALYYKNRRAPIYDLDDEMEHEEPEEPGSYDDMVDSLMEEIDEDSEVGQLVRATLESKLNWHLINRNLDDPQFKRDFRRTLMEVRRSAKENLQGNGVLSAGGSPGKILSGASGIGEKGSGAELQETLLKRKAQRLGQSLQQPQVEDPQSREAQGLPVL